MYKTAGVRGFTIVELLIVIVVIGILAAITIVAFNGIQSRANNNAKVTAVKSYMKLIAGYRATYSEDPSSTTSCATVDNSCTSNSGVVQSSSNNTTLIANLRKIGTPPASLLPAVNGNYGMQYIREDATLDGAATTIRLEYWLQGDNVPCGVEKVSNNTLPAATTPTNGFTTSSAGRTTCWIRM